MLVISDIDLVLRKHPRRSQRNDAVNLKVKHLQGGDMEAKLPIGSRYTNYKGMNDTALVEAAKSGQNAAYAELVFRHEKVLMRVIVRMTKDTVVSEDIVQDALLKGFTKIHLFRGQSSFKSWLIRIAINTAKNKLRSMKRVMMDLEDAQLSESSTAESDIFNETISDNIQTLVKELPSKQKRALALRVFSGLSFKEIAFLMECPYDTAKANYRHALLKLKDKITNNHIFEGWNEAI